MFPHRAFMTTHVTFYYPIGMYADRWILSCSSNLPIGNVSWLMKSFMWLLPSNGDARWLMKVIMWFLLANQRIVKVSCDGRITWKDSSVSVHFYWMMRGHMSGHECPVWEPQFLLAVENQMEVFCGNVYFNHILINIRWPMTSWWCHIVMSCCIIYLFLSSSVCIC